MATRVSGIICLIILVSENVIRAHSNCDSFFSSFFSIFRVSHAFGFVSTPINVCAAKKNHRAMTKEK